MKIVQFVALIVIAFPSVSVSQSLAQTVDFRPTEIVNGNKAIANEVLVQFKAAVAQSQGKMTSADRVQSENQSISSVQTTFQTEYVRPIGGAGWYLVHSNANSAD